MTPPDAPAGHGPARVEVRLSGRVQGVGFRWFVRSEALRLGLSGWVANRADGSVEAVAEGERLDLETLLERLSVGPPGASVTDVAVHWSPGDGGFVGFAIHSGSHPGD